MTRSIFPVFFFLIIILNSCKPDSPVQTENTDLLLKNYKPESVYKVPVTKVERAKFPVIDIHSHPYAMSKQDIDNWINNMNQFGIERTILLTYSTGASFDSIVEQYSDYPDRFELWCGFDYTGFEEEGWADHAVAELERCFNNGARGIGEMGDKGFGLYYSKPSPAYGMHIDDPRLKLLLAKCAELNMPINIHIAEPIWMYETIDSTNDGMYNAAKWRIDLTQPGILNHAELIQTLDNALSMNPATTFIACHFANCSYDLEMLAKMFDKHPNLYADISARYGETAPIPRYMKEFYIRYQDRLLYGTDMGFDRKMYESTFRILETADEHFYYPNQYNYHWPLHGFKLPDEVLRKVYKENALKVLKR